MSKVRLLYDFQAEGPNELTALTGTELFLINSTMFDGWIQVKNMKGEVGIVPSSYVENITDENEEDIPPPPSYVNTTWNANSTAVSLPNSSSFTNNSSNLAEYSPYHNQSSISNNNNINSWGGSLKSNNEKPRQTNSDDEDSDDFDEDDNVSNKFSASNRGFTSANTTINVSNQGSVIAKPKTKNPFGLEVFLLHGAVVHVQDSDRTSTIILNEQGQSVWKRTSPSYPISITGYQADKKYHGVKKFTSYEIKAKIFPQKVKRRYNHFDWLHKRLVEKFGMSICIPPLPDKAVTGNFEDEFIAKRKAQLELWLNRMSSHPVVGQSEVFVHFLQCDDNSSKWKPGKRKAERDEYRGAQWFCTLTVPGESVDTTNNIKEKVDKFSKAAINFDNCIKNVSFALEKISNYHSTTYKKELVHFGKKLEELGLSLSNDSLDAPNNSLLSTALITAGNTYAQIGNQYAEQSKIDINLLLDRFSLYRGISQQMPEIMAFEKSSIHVYEDFQQRQEKLEGQSLIEVAPRREIISHVTFAEINLFNQEKVDDFNQYMRTFLGQQIAFYTEITECLKRAYSNFEKIPKSSNNINSRK